MANRKRSPLHDYWHIRVEGQIRDCIFHHPEWFKFEHNYDRTHCINSLAKRIVGEIVAGGISGAMRADMSSLCVSSSADNDGLTLSLSKPVVTANCSGFVKPSEDHHA